MDIADPDELVAVRGAARGGGHSLVTGYENPQAEDLAKQAQQEFDKTKRQALYTELQKKAAGVGVPRRSLFYQPFPYATATNVQGFYVQPTGLYDMGRLALIRSPAPSRHGARSADEVRPLHPAAAGDAVPVLLGISLRRLHADQAGTRRPGGDAARDSTSPTEAVAALHKQLGLDRPVCSSST